MGRPPFSEGFFRPPLAKENLRKHKGGAFAEKGARANPVCTEGGERAWGLCALTPRDHPGNPAHDYAGWTPL